MPDKGLYLGVSGGVEKKLLQDLESLEKRLKSLLEGMKSKPQTKQFDKVKEQIKLLSNLFGALKEHFQESAGAIERSTEGITKSLQELTESSNPALQEFGSKLEIVQDEFSGAHSSVKKIIPDLEKFISLIEGFDGGNTRPITVKYNSLSEAVENAKDEYIDLQEAAEGVYELRKNIPDLKTPETKEIKPIDDKELKKVAKTFNDELGAIYSAGFDLHGKLREAVDDVTESVVVGTKQIANYEKELEGIEEGLSSLDDKFGDFKDKVSVVGHGFKSVNDLVIDLKTNIDQLKKKLDSIEGLDEKFDTEKLIGTEGGSVLNKELRLQDQYKGAADPDAYDFLEEADRKLEDVSDAIKEQKSAWNELKEAIRVVETELKDAIAAGTQGGDQAAKILLLWRDQLEYVEKELKKQGKSLDEVAEKEKEVRKEVEKTSDVEERSLEEKKKALEQANADLAEQAAQIEETRKKEQESAEKEADAVEKSGRRKVKVRKKSKKAAKEEADTVRVSGEQVVETAEKTAERTEEITEKQRERLTEPVAAQVDFSNAEEQFKNFTEKVEKGVTDLSNSIKGIFSSLEDLIREGVRTVEISVTPKGFDETVSKQERLDEALLKSARTAEEVSQREQQAFLESAAAFVSASDTITEHQKEVDDALEHSGDVAEKVSDKEREAFSGISTGGKKIEAPEAESGTLDLMAQLLVQVTRNLDLMSQKLDAAKSDVRDFNEDLKGATKSTEDFADEAEKAASEEKIQHIKAYNEVYGRMKAFLGSTAEAMAGTTSRAKELANQVVKFGISLRETGVLKTNEEFEQWVNGLEASNIALADHRGEIKKTAKGFRPLVDGSAELLGITDEMNEEFQKNSETITAYEKRLYELQKAYAAGDEGAETLASALIVLGERIGKNETAFKRINDLVTKSNQHLKDLARRADETSEEVIKNVELSSVAFEAYEGNIKVTKDSLEVLNKDGYEPFIDLNEDAARSLGLIGRKFDKSARDSEKYKESLQKVSSKTDFYSEAMRKLSEKYGDSEFHTRAYNKAIRKTQRYISEVTALLSYEISELEREIQKRRESGESIEDLNEKLEKKKRHLKEVTHETNAAEVALDRYEDEMKGTDKAFRRFNKYITMSSKNIGFLGKSFSMIGKRVKQFAAFAVAAMIVQQLTEAVRVFIEVLSDYDQALYNLMAILEVTASRVAVLGDQIQKVAQNTKFSATEVAEAVQTLGQAGLTIEEVGIALVGVTRLATGTLSDIGDVADLTTTALNSFRLEAVETTRTSDIFANAINNSKLNVDKLRTAFNYVGAAGKQVGLNLNELTGTLMVLADNGIRASTMGTGLRRMMLKMLSPTTELQAELEQLGMNAEDLNPKLVGWETAVKNLIPVLWDAEKQSMDMAKTVDYFGTRAAQVAAIVVRSVADGSKAISEATEKTYEYGAAQEMSEKQQRGLALSIKNLIDRFKNLGIAIGEAGFTGIVKDAIDALRLLTGAAYDMMKTGNRVFIDVVGWAGAVTTLMLAIAGYNKLLFKARKMMYKYHRILEVLNRAFFIKLAVVTAIVAVFDQLVSWHYDAATAASKHAQELATAAEAMESWGETLNKAFASREWENTIQRFKEETQDAGGEVANLSSKIEDKLGHSIEAITGPSGMARLNEAWKELRKEMLAESIDKTVDSLQNLQTSMDVVHSLGVDLGEEFNTSTSRMSKFGNAISDFILTISNQGRIPVSWTEKMREGIIDLFGPDKKELVQKFSEEISNFTQQVSKTAEAEGWDTARIIDFMNELGKEVDKDSLKWEKMTEKMSQTTFAPLISELRNVSYESRKQMTDLKNLIDTRKEEGLATESQVNELKNLEISYEAQQEALKKFEEGLADVVSGEKTLEEVMLELAASGQFTADQMDRLRFSMEKKLIKTTGMALTSFERFSDKLRKTGTEAMEMYRQLDPADRMSFDAAFASILEESEKLRAHLESSADDFGYSQDQIDQIVSESVRKRTKEELEGLLKIDKQLEEHLEAYLESYEEINEHLIDIFEARKDIINRHYDWQKRRIEETVSDEGTVLRKTVELERKRINDIKRLIEQEYQARKSTIKRETQDLMEVYRDDIEERENIQREGNDKIESLDEEINDRRKDNLNEWLDVLQDAYSEAKDLSKDYADEVKSLEKEILDLQKERAENVKDIEQNLADDLREIRRAGMTDAEALREEFQYAAKMYQEGLDLIELGNYEEAKQSLKEAVDIYGDTAREAAEAEKQGEQYARSAQELTQRMINAYEALKEAETEEKDAAISKLKEQIESFEELKNKIDESAEMYRKMTEEVMGKLDEIDNFEIADKEYKIKSNVREEINSVKNLVNDLNNLAGRTFTYYTQGVPKKAAGGLIEGAKKFALGGTVPGSGTGDKVPAMLEPGEFVIPRRIVDDLGLDYFRSLISGASDKLQRFNAGGLVQPIPQVAPQSSQARKVVDEGVLTVRFETDDLTAPVKISDPASKAAIRDFTKELSKRRMVYGR